MHVFLAASCLFRAGVTAIMECPEPTVPRHLLIAVIAFVIAVMELMIKRPQRQLALIFDQQVFVARVRHRSAGAQIDHMEEKMDRVAWDHAMDQQR